MKKNKTHLIVIILLIIYYFLTKYTPISIPCIFHKITNLWCPGCGVTRMIIYITKGDFKNAFLSNQLLFITGPIILFLYADTIISNFKNKEPLYKKIPNSIYYIFLVLLIVFAIIRNIYPEFTNLV